ncbi:MAG: response regulator transcription factor [Bacteroidales bacterium]|jgi:DNA-binding response OmpR family regulator|nr:MAG: two component transcriptional regulator, winged helix family [bacterium F082]KWW28852.1 MAG: two component transcriptional regulator, winged helix family [bacterium P201]MBR0540348.1 response regulator transcription factor [Bacteroidales bacterium]MBR6227179.1 response regulator transcription factor [Bacteroidales bacterium]
MSHTKILLAEDDRNLGMILKAFLESKGYSTTLCMNGEEAWNTLSTADFDLCITDVVMPIMDGFTLAKQIKSVRPMMPIIILTAKKEQEDVLEGFGIGVEDYVTKPFSMDELLARIKVWERWCAYIQVKAQPSLFHLGSYTFDAPRHLLINGKETKKLTSKEADLLLMLCENMGNTLERAKALQQIWEEENYLNARSMDVYITKLRKYFKDDPSVDIQNVHGVGFKLVVR